MEYEDMMMKHFLCDGLEWYIYAISKSRDKVRLWLKYGFKASVICMCDKRFTCQVVSYVFCKDIPPTFD